MGVRAGARVARDRLSSPSATACSSAASGCRRGRVRATRRSHRATRSRSPRSRRPVPRTSPTRSRRARGVRRPGRRCRAAERAKYLFRIARLLQERAREFAVLESLDGGKPIKESRDVDLPLAAAHFFYHAGWADKLEYAFPGRRAAPARRRRPDHPLELPAADGRLEARPGARGRQHRRAKPAETTPLTALLLAEILAQAELPPGVVNIVTGDGRDRRGAGGPGRRQDRLHRSTEVGKAIQRAPRRQRQAAHARARRQGGEHRLRRRADRPGRRGHRQRHLLQPGPRLLRRLAAARPGAGRRAGDREAEATGSTTLRVGDPLDKNTDVGAINSRAQLEKIQRARRGRRAPRAPSSTSRPARCPSAGYWFPPTRLHRRRAEPPDRAARRSSARCSPC